MWSLFFGWLPLWGQIVVALVVAVLVISLILRVVGAVLDALPFV